MLREETTDGADTTQSWAEQIRQQVPETLRQEVFLLELWQWIGLGVIAFLGVLVDRAVVRGLSTLLQRWTGAQGGSGPRSTAIRRAMRPLGLLAGAGVWWVGVGILALPEGPIWC